MSPRDYARTDRVERLAKEVLGEAMLKLKDPRVGFATITSVKVTPDLRHAKVYVSILGDEHAKEQTLQGLLSATPHLRRVMGREVRMKFLPDIEFFEDDTAEHLLRIDALLKLDEEQK